MAPPALVTAMSPVIWAPMVIVFWLTNTFNSPEPEVICPAPVKPWPALVWPRMPPVFTVSSVPAFRVWVAPPLKRIELTLVLADSVRLVPSLTLSVVPAVERLVEL